MNRFSNAPLTLILIGVNAALFIVEELFRVFYDTSLFPLMALSREGLLQGGLWQLLTHAFLHGNLLHLLVNMLALWFTGPILEEMLGWARYLILYIGGAVVGGLVQTFCDSSAINLVGASGAVRALLVGFGTLQPRLEITALIFFVIPVRMKASTLAWLVIVGSFIFWLFGIERGIGHLAHLGGGIAGYLICRLFIAQGLPRVPPPIEHPDF